MLLVSRHACTAWTVFGHASLLVFVVIAFAAVVCLPLSVPCHVIHRRSLCVVPWGRDDRAPLCTTICVFFLCSQLGIESVRFLASLAAWLLCFLLTLANVRGGGVCSASHATSLLLVTLLTLLA